MSNYPPGVTGAEYQITGMSEESIRIPARLVFYLSGTGWGQRAETVTDAARLQLLAMLDTKPARDGSYRITDPSQALLLRLWYEADHLMDSYRYGDKDSDTLADYNAGRSVIRQVDRLLPSGLPRGMQSHGLMEEE